MGKKEGMKKSDQYPLLKWRRAFRPLFLSQSISEGEIFAIQR